MKRCKGGICLLNPFGYEATCWDCKLYSGKRPKPLRKMPEHKAFAVRDTVPAEDAVETVCAFCGRLFYAPKNKKYCSRSCSKKAYRARRAARGGRNKLYSEKECVICHCVFQPRTDQQKTCGGDCTIKYLQKKYHRGVSRNYPSKLPYSQRIKPFMETRENTPVERLRDTVLQIRRHSPYAHVTPSGLEALANKLTSAFPWWRNISKPRQAVLLDVAFSWGFDGLCGMQKMMQHIKQGHWQAARQSLLNSRYAFSSGRSAVENARQLAEDRWTIIKPYIPQEEDDDELDDIWDEETE